MLDEDLLLRDFEDQIRQKVAGEEKLAQLWGTCEHEGEPDYEALKRHCEVWIQTHPAEIAEFLEYQRSERANQIKDTGANKDNSFRHFGAMPPGLYQLFTILSPNFMGHLEPTPEAKRKRMMKFLREFPVFRTSKKL